jgi:beta-N-acetylhexosaminidase
MRALLHTLASILSPRAMAAPAPRVAALTLAMPLAFTLSSCGPAGAAASSGAEVRWVEATLASLTLEERIGQLMFPWISGAYLGDDDPEYDELFRWVEEDRVGGVVISIGTPHAYGAKLNALQARARIPLLVTSDFENGGPGMRINHLYALPTMLPAGGGASFPPTMAFGAVGDEALVERFGEATAREARAVGVHVVFAPVLDVNSNPENPIINTRAFGEDPEVVGRLGGAFIRGVAAGGALSTGKHFPGHGDTRVDSHLTLPEVTADMDRLQAVEFVPFRRAIEAGVDGIMTAHVSVPGVLGPNAVPATLSPVFMTDILRDSLGFKGVVYTDALRMGAITESYGGGEAAVLAFEAGADVLLIPERVDEAIAAMLEAVASGRISEARIEASVRHILQEKARVGLHRGEAMVSLDAISAQVGIRAHLELADEVAARSITLVRDRQGLLPPDPATLGRIVSITWAAPTDLVAGREFNAVLTGLFPEQVTQVRVGPDTPPERYAELLAQPRGAGDRVILSVYLPPRAGVGSVALPEPFQRFARTMAERAPTILVSLGNPYLLGALPEMGTYLIGWGDREVSQRAAARAVAGAAPISGRLPIGIPPLHAVGEGLDREAHPEMARRAGARGDALDEAGLVRRRDGDAPGGQTHQNQTQTTPSPLEIEDAASIGLDPEALAAVDDAIQQAIAAGVTPGAALVVGRGGRVARLRGFGHLDWAPGSAPVTAESVWDLASLTKVLGTTWAVLHLADHGQLDLDAPVVRYLPSWAAGDPRKTRVTIRDLLLHRGGLPPFERFYLSHPDGVGIREAVDALVLASDPGTTTVYSDLGFKTLGWVIEAVTGRGLEAVLEDGLTRPLGLQAFTFNPPASWQSRVAPTEVTEDRGHVRGIVHDENAWVLGGVAGHAGLFASAADLAVLGMALARGGEAPPCTGAPGSGIPCVTPRTDAVRILAPATLSAATRRYDASATRALGWDTPTLPDPGAGAGAGSGAGGPTTTAAAVPAFPGAGSFGHTGFTGTSIWVDPSDGLFVILLTNRVNPTRENTAHIALRRTVHEAVGAARRAIPAR